MHTPSLGRRVVVTGVLIVVLLAVSLDLLILVSVRSGLQSGIERDLDRVELVVRAVARAGEPGTIAPQLAQLDISARVRDQSGSLLPDQTAVGFAGAVTTRRVALPGGMTADIAVSRADADRTMRRVVLLEAIGTPLVVALAVLLLRLVAEVALRPLDRIAAAARRTTEGHRGHRLSPDSPDTRLGQMASAYDQMLDALESAVGRAEAAQAETERLLERNRRIIDTAREAFVAVDERGLIIDWNEQAERVFGWGRADVIGRPAAGTLFPDEPLGGGGEGSERFLGVNVTGSSERVVELTVLHRAGHCFPARMTAWITHHPGGYTISAFMWDVTDRLKVEEALNRLAAVVESAADAIISITLDGTIETWNPGAESMFGYPASEAVGRHFHLVVPKDLREEADRNLDAVRKGAGVQRYESLGLRRNGGIVEVAVAVSPVRDASGAVCATSSVVRDITEERRIAGRLDDSLRALEDALNEARASEQDTRQFLDDAAHQLRAPIANIRACAEALLIEPEAPARDELLSALVAETRRSGQLVRGLLRLARLNHGQPLERIPCDVLELLSVQVEPLRTLAPDLGVSVAARSGSDPVGRPVIDPHVLTEIVANLLENACRHARTCINLVVHRHAGWLAVEVDDDGAGLPEALVDKVFDRFVSLDGEGGSGLGLPIARELARAHGGDIVYEGNAFVVRLPIGAEDVVTVSGSLERADQPESSAPALPSW